MRLDIKGDKLFLKNDYAGCMWIFYTFLLIPFVLGIYFLWQEPRASAPLYFVLPFTIVFLIAAPIMVRHAFKMRIVTMEIDRTRGEILISKSAFFSKNQQVRELDDIERIEVECSDNDGEFFNVSLYFKDGQELPILHGNHKESIFDQIDEITNFLKVRGFQVPLSKIEV